MTAVELILFAAELLAAAVRGDRPLVVAIGRRLADEAVRELPAEPEYLTDEGAAAAEAVARQVAALKER